MFYDVSAESLTDSTQEQPKSKTSSKKEPLLGKAWLIALPILSALLTIFMFCPCYRLGDLQFSLLGDLMLKSSVGGMVALGVFALIANIAILIYSGICLLLNKNNLAKLNLTNVIVYPIFAVLELILAIITMSRYGDALNFIQFCGVVSYILWCALGAYLLALTIIQIIKLNTEPKTPKDKTLLEEQKKEKAAKKLEQNAEKEKNKKEAQAQREKKRQERKMKPISKFFFLPIALLLTAIIVCHLIHPAFFYNSFLWYICLIVIIIFCVYSFVMICLKQKQFNSIIKINNTLLFIISIVSLGIAIYSFIDLVKIGQDITRSSQPNFNMTIYAVAMAIATVLLAMTMIYSLILAIYSCVKEKRINKNK